MEIKPHKFENGETLTFAQYCEAANYGTDIMYLRGMKWHIPEIKFKHLADLFGITPEQAKTEYKRIGYDVK